MGNVNTLLNTKSLSTKPSNVLPLHLKQTFPPIVWIFTKGDGIKFRIHFKIFSTLSVPEISQITGTLMPDTNPEIIKDSLLYDFTEVVRCEDCDSVLDQNLSYFYLKCLLRKLDCFSECAIKSGKEQEKLGKDL